jgi:hypothetical protein
MFLYAVFILIWPVLLYGIYLEETGFRPTFKLEFP